MFEIGINVEDYLKRIERLVKVGINIKEIHHNAKAVKNFASYIKSEHGVYITPKLSTLNSIIKSLSLIEKSKELKTIKKEFETVSVLFNDFFNESVVYLARHPEKTKEEKRSLSHQGVKQAQKFAKFVSEMILFCPKKVKLKLNYSEIGRTYLVARAVEMKVKQITAQQKKEVNFTEMMEHPALLFRFTKEAIADFGKDKKAGKGEFEIFSGWMHGGYPSFPDHNKISNEITAWAKQNLSVMGPDEWQVTIGVCHSFVIDCFLWYNTGGNIDSLIETMEFIKMYPHTFYYREKWYDLK